LGTVASICTLRVWSSTFELIAENDFDDYTLSSPAVSGGQIFFRTAKFLYAVGKGSG